MLSFYITGGLYIETPQAFGGRRAFLLWLPRGGGGIAYLILHKSFYMSCRYFSYEDPVFNESMKLLEIMQLWQLDVSDPYRAHSFSASIKNERSIKNG